MRVDGILHGGVGEVRYTAGKVELPQYARIESLAEVPRVSRYSDLLDVMVTWCWMWAFEPTTPALAFRIAAIA